MAETRSRDLADVVGTGTSLPSATSIGAVSSTELGYLDGVTSGLQSQIDSKLNLAGGKILQIVRATDATSRTTTSASFVDADLSVTISPNKSDSAVILLHTAAVATDNTRIFLQITDSSNNAISGSSEAQNGNGASTWRGHVTNVGYSTPATTSSTTYKVRFRAENSGQTAYLQNNLLTAQLYAIEVSA